MGHTHDSGTATVQITNSLIAPSVLLAEVAARYDLGDALDCRFWNPGVNDTYLVRTERGGYILRVYRQGLRSAADIAYELEHLLLLEARGLAVAAPVCQRDGSPFWSLNAPEGRRCAALFAYVAGAELKHTAAETELYGATLAAIHTLTDGYTSRNARGALDGELLVTAPLRAIAPFLAHRPADWAFLERVAAAARARLAQLPRDTLDTGFCHGDPHGQNAHIAPDGTLRFFDFDCCGPGWRAYDLATFRWGPVGRDDSAWAAFLAGYTLARPVSSADLEAVPLFVVLRHLWLWGLHASNADVWGCGWMNDAYWDAGGAGGFAFLRTWVATYLPEAGV